MPSYYPRPSAAQLPLTPPDSGSGYAYTTMHYAADPYAAAGMNPYLQSAVGSAMAFPYNGYQSSANSLPPIQANYYEPMGAPTLPPLRMTDHAPYVDDYQRRMQHDHAAAAAAAREQHRQASNSTAVATAPATANKEEKAVGGVSAKLDYDMERMTDFVTQAAQSIFQSQVQSPPSFRKWVHQVLSATRLPSATILLSLHYLSNRVTNFPSSISPGENQIYRLLAVALILGSKFLDDNTFVNRSWSDVTGIKVVELNMLEMKWLQLISYKLHVDLKAPNGLQAWIDAWKKYDAEYTAKHQPMRLSPLDTSGHHLAGRDRFTPYPSPYLTSARSFDGLLSAHSAPYPTTPYSATDPWAPSDRSSQDNYYKRQQRYAPSFPEMDTLTPNDDRSRQSSVTFPQPAFDSYYQTPPYGAAWNQPPWAGVHRYDCTCAGCAYQHHCRAYPVPSSYAAQTVMG